MEYDDYYIEEYNETIKELLSSLPEEERSDVRSELLENHNIKRSDDGENDARKNVMSAYRDSSGSGGFDKDSNSLMEHIAKTEGVSKQEVRAWGRKALKGEGKAYLDKWGRM